MTIEDETGPVNVMVWKALGERQRDVESDGEVRHLVAQRLQDLTPLLSRLGQQSSKSRDFH